MIGALELVLILREPIDRDEAARDARREVSKKIYQDEQPSAIIRAFDWLQDTLDRWLNRASESVPGGGIGLLVLALLIIGVVVVIVVWLGPLRRTARRSSTAETEAVQPTRSRDEHADRADRFAAEGRYAEAVRERLRAIVKGLADRDVIEDRPGRTAVEIATEAGTAMPSVFDDLLDAAGLFNAIWFGDQEATADDDATMRTIDAKVRAAKPDDAVPHAAARTTWAAPGAGEGR